MLKRNKKDEKWNSPLFIPDPDALGEDIIENYEFSLENLRERVSNINEK